MITTNAFDYINVLDKAADASWLRETARVVLFEQLYRAESLTRGLPYHH